MKYFVRASDDAPEKGPYELESLQKSFDKGLLKPEAMAREEGSETWVSLKQLFAPVVAKREKKRSSEDDADFQRARDIELHHEHQQRNANQNLSLGLAMIALGVILTVISMSAAGGGGAIFIGLIVFGLVRVVRGAASR